jgi:hypothetical protein
VSGDRRAELSDHCEDTRGQFPYSHRRNCGGSLVRFPTFVLHVLRPTVTPTIVATMFSGGRESWPTD